MVQKYHLLTLCFSQSKTEKDNLKTCTEVQFALISTGEDGENKIRKKLLLESCKGERRGRR